jgi:hypothetical protein
MTTIINNERDKRMTEIISTMIRNHDQIADHLSEDERYLCSCCNEEINLSHHSGSGILGVLHSTPMCLTCWSVEMDQREITDLDRIEFLTFTKKHDGDWGETDYEVELVDILDREPEFVSEVLGITSDFYEADEETLDESAEVDYFEYAVADEFIQKEIYAGAELP